MKYYHIAPEKELSNIFTKGVLKNKKGEIIIITLKEEFMLKKFIFDVYAHEELKVDTYCAFEISEKGIEGPLFKTAINSIYSDSYKVTMQHLIDKKFLKFFKSGETYGGMGLLEGVLPVEHKDKFTELYKRKVLEYLKEVVS